MCIRDSYSWFENNDIYRYVRCSAVYPWTPNVATRGILTYLENTKSHFRPGLRPGPRWGSSRRSPRPPSRLGRGYEGDTPSPFPTPSTPSASRFSAPMAPRNSTPSAFRLGAVDCMCPSTSIECPPPNKFCWRRAWLWRLVTVALRAPYNSTFTLNYIQC